MLKIIKVAEAEIFPCSETLKSDWNDKYSKRW